MSGAFEAATRAAIQDLIQTHAQASRFGYVLTHEGFQDLTTDLYSLLETSRTLKAAGDRFLATGGASAGTKQGGRPPKPR